MKIFTNKELRFFEVNSLKDYEIFERSVKVELKNTNLSDIFLEMEINSSVDKENNGHLSVIILLIVTILVILISLIICYKSKKDTES